MIALPVIVTVPDHAGASSAAANTSTPADGVAPMLMSRHVTPGGKPSATICTGPAKPSRRSTPTCTAT